VTDLARFGSLYNWLPAGVAPPGGRGAAFIHDLTLEGDGEEMAGVSISTEDKLEIARRLAEIGVAEISVLGNSPRPSPEDVRVAEGIVALGLPMRVGAFVKTEEEIRTSARIGLRGVTILVWVNDRSLPAGTGGRDVLAKSRHLTGVAKEQGLHTNFMAMDATRTRPEFLREVVEAVEPTCDEYTIADSRGVISPFGLRSLIEQVRSWTARPLQVHCHNHSSMAVANGVAAVLGGVVGLQTTVNGLGELAGLLALEEIAVAVPMHAGISTGIDLARLKSLSDFVVRATGVPISTHKPVVGDRAFCIPETEDIQQIVYGRATRGLLEESVVYPPRLVGNELHVSIGRKCNEYTVRYHLFANGLTAEPDAIHAIVEAVRAVAAAADGFFLMDEAAFLELVRRGGFAVQPLAAGAQDRGPGPG
jgi:isopropylmalate/homocitrate/citramalate synthase